MRNWNKYWKCQFLKSWSNDFLTLFFTLGKSDLFFFVKKWAIHSLFFFWPFECKQYNLYAKLMWRNVRLVSGAGFRTNSLLNVSLGTPITTRPFLRLCYYGQNMTVNLQKVEKIMQFGHKFWRRFVLKWLNFTKSGHIGIDHLWLENLFFTV